MSMHRCRLAMEKVSKEVADRIAKYPSQKLMSNSNEIYQFKYKLKEMKSKNKIKISIANKCNFLTLSRLQNCSTLCHGV